MTQPRLVEPGATYLLSRRTVCRFHLFAPDPRMKRIFLYVLAIAAARTGVLVHAAVLMSDHEHLVVTDPEARLPEFLHYLHRHVALGTKVLRDWDGAVWDHAPTNAVELLTPQAVVEKLGYTIANPVEAGLVARAEDWPGVTTRPSEIGTAVWRIERPREYFTADDDTWPPHVELRLAMPRAARELGASEEQFRELVKHDVASREKGARAEAKALRRGFLGADRCAKLSPLRRARSPEPIRARNPTFAVGRGNPDAYLAAAARVRAFRVAHRRAFDFWRVGHREVVFPAGTWLMRHRHGACVEEPRRAVA